MKKIVLSFLMSCIIVLCATSAFAAKKEIKLQSPNGKLNLSVQLGDTLSYSVLLGKEKLIRNSHIGLELGDGTLLGKQPRLLQQKSRKATENITSPHYRFNSFASSYNELNITLNGEYGILFRAYNEGIAYRFYTTKKTNIEIRNELAEFNLEKDYTAYLPYTTGKKDPFAMAFQNTYDVKRLSEANNALAFLPVAVDCGGGVKLTILESDLESYPGMFVQSQGAKQSLKGGFC